MKQQSNIKTFALVMLMTGAVDGVGNLPSIAIFGQQLVFFFVIACFFFLFPVGIISAELCAQFKTDGGIYFWTKKAFGSHVAGLVIWLQWINTMVWFPTCLTTLVGTAAYLINPKLVHHPMFLVGTSQLIFWIMTLLNFKGIKHSTNISAIATTIGMILPMVLIIMLCLIWVFLGKPLALDLNANAIFPKLSSTTTWTSLTAIMTAFLGMELATVHVGKIKNPQTIFSKALIISIIIIVLTMGLGSLGVALVIPHQNIVLVSGTIQAFNELFTGLHLKQLEYLLGLMLLFGSLGTMVNWLISPANGLAQAAKDNYLPKILARENQHQTPVMILILQGMVVTIISLGFFLMPSINGSYWLLLDLSTELYIIMYLFMFVVAIKLTLSFEKFIIIPGGKITALIICSGGFIGSFIAFIVGFFPPANLNVGTPLHYISLFTLGIIILISPAPMLIWYNYHKTKKLKQIKVSKIKPNTETIILQGEFL